MTALFAASNSLHNTARDLYLTIRGEPGLTRQELGQRLNLTATTLGRVLDQLTTAGLIAVSEQAESTGGRRAGLYETCDGARVFGGFMCGAVRSVFVLTDLGLRVLAAEELPGQDLCRGKDGAKRIAKLARRMVQASGLSLDALLGIGIAESPDAGTAGDEELTASLTAQLTTDVRSLSAPDALLRLAFWRKDPPAGRTIVFYAENTLWCGLADAPALKPSATMQLLDSWLAQPRSGGLKPLGRFASGHGLLGAFRRVKDDVSLQFDDFVRAVHLGKKKAGFTQSEAAAALALTLHNIRQFQDCASLLMAGPLLEQLPDLARQITLNLQELAGQEPLSCEQPDTAVALATGAAAAAFEAALNLG